MENDEILPIIELSHDELIALSKPLNPTKTDPELDNRYTGDSFKRSSAAAHLRYCDPSISQFVDRDRFQINDGTLS